MTFSWHNQEATEAAVAHLLAESLLMIRYLSAPDGDRSVPDNRRQDQVHTLADLCHNLPAWLGPTRRERIHEGIAYMPKRSAVPGLFQLVASVLPQLHAGTQRRHSVPIGQGRITNLAGVGAEAHANEASQGSLL